MKTGISNQSRFILLVTSAAVWAFAPSLRADWGRPDNWSGRSHANIERHPAFRGSDLCPGTTLDVLPAGCVQVSVGATGYYYCNGVYFQATTTGAYAVVSPPVGVLVPQLPASAQTIAVGSATYYYAGGAFYLQQYNGFTLMPAPAGVTVLRLPPGAAPVVIDQALYYLADNVYYIPITQGAVTVYVTARP